VIGNCFAQWIGHRGLRPASSWLHYYYYYYWVRSRVDNFRLKVAAVAQFTEFTTCSGKLFQTHYWQMKIISWAIAWQDRRRTLFEVDRNGWISTGLLWRMCFTKMSFVITTRTCAMTLAYFPVTHCARNKDRYVRMQPWCNDVISAVGETERRPSTTTTSI